MRVPDGYDQLIDPLKGLSLRRHMPVNPSNMRLIHWEAIVDVIAAIHARRSVRSYSSRPVSPELIEEVIWDAAQAPPPFSRQTRGHSTFFRARIGLPPTAMKR
jgi:Nitroreductase family